MQSIFISAFLLLLPTLGFAAPMDGSVDATVDNSLSYGTGGGVLGLIVLVLDIIAFVEIVKSNRKTLEKLLWCLVVFLFPIVGMVIYYLFSNRKAHKDHEYTPLP